jgi:hypothetical protein
LVLSPSPAILESACFQFLDKDGPDFKRLRMDQVDVKRRDEEEKKLRLQDKKVGPSPVLLLIFVGVS